MARKWHHNGAMDLTPYVDGLLGEYADNADAAGPEARALAERLAAPLESALRLTLFEVLSAAAGEITSELAPGSVDVRLRGREPSFVVTPPPSDSAGDDSDASPVGLGARPVLEGDDSSMVRINLRLPEELKGKVEEAARQLGLSVNSWLVRAAGAALDTEPRGRADRRVPTGSDRFRGWVQ